MELIDKGEQTNIIYFIEIVNTCKYKERMYDM